MGVQNCMFPITMFIDSLQPHPTSLANSESPISMTNLSVQTRLGEGGSRGFSVNTRQMLSPYPILCHVTQVGPITVMIGAFFFRLAPKAITFF